MVLITGRCQCGCLAAPYRAVLFSRATGESPVTREDVHDTVMYWLDWPLEGTDALIPSIVCLKTQNKKKKMNFGNLVDVARVSGLSYRISHLSVFLSGKRFMLISLGSQDVYVNGLNF